MKNNDININLNQQGGEPKASIVAKTFNNIANTIANTSWKKIFKVFFVMFFFLATILVGIYAYNIVSNKELVKQHVQRIMDGDINDENIRDYVVTPKIQRDLDILVYTLGAERVFIFELHNGKKNTSGLPFRFADMTYEETNHEKKIDKVAMKFQNIPLTLYKYPHYLQKMKIMMGTVDEIETIDCDFAEHIREIGGKYLGMIYLAGDGVPLGFLCVSYHDLSNMPNEELIKNKLIEYGKVIEELLDLEVQAKRKSNENVYEKYIQ